MGGGAEASIRRGAGLLATIPASSTGGTPLRRWPGSTRGARAVLALALGAMSGSVGRADEPPQAAPAVSPATPEKLAADAVLAAVAAKGEPALRALAAKDDPDPWLVADELLARGENEAAKAFVQAAPRVDVEALPA